MLGKHFTDLARIGANAVYVPPNSEFARLAGATN
jgi:hypothetical protein